MVRLVLFALLTAAIEIGIVHARQVGSTLTCNGRSRRCMDCKTILRCTQLNGVYWPLRADACPPATPYCQVDKCVASPPKEICITTAEPKINSGFLCVADGYYPDPSSCRRYYLCVENVAYQYECVGNSVYHHQAAMCIGSGAVCSTTECTPLLVGKYQLYKGDPTVYVVCMDANPSNALVARCPRNHTMDAKTVSCQPACTGPGRYAVSHGSARSVLTEYYECVETYTNHYEGPVRKTCPGTSVFSKEMQRCVEAPVELPTTTPLPEPKSSTQILTTLQTDVSTTKSFVTTQPTQTAGSSFEPPSPNETPSTQASTIDTATITNMTTASQNLDKTTKSIGTFTAQTRSSQKSTEESTTTTTTILSSLVTDDVTVSPTETTATVISSTPVSIVTTSTNTSPSSNSPQSTTDQSTSQTDAAQVSSTTEFVPTSDPTSLSTDNARTSTDSISTTASPNLDTSTQSTSTSTAQTSSLEKSTEESTTTTTTILSSLVTDDVTVSPTETTATVISSTPVSIVTASTNTSPSSNLPQSATDQSTSQTDAAQVSSTTEFVPTSDPTSLSTDNARTSTDSISTTASPNLDTSTQSTSTSTAQTRSSQKSTEESKTTTTTILSSLVTEIRTDTLTETTATVISSTPVSIVTTSTNTLPSSNTPQPTTKQSTSQTDATQVSSTTESLPTPGDREDFFTPDASVSEDFYIMPVNFRLGATSSAYQTEGAWDADGKGPSIQDDFYHGSGGDSGDIACNSYAEYLVDVNLLRNMTFQTYHFSMSWSRLLPTGSSLHANQAAINFYDKLLSTLIENKIEPVVTLHHWDIPSVIVNGWLNSSAPDYFLDYATFAFSLFGSRVSTWLLLHDPVTLCVQGYAEGRIGPGIVDPQGTAAYRCVHNQILAHAQAYRAYHRDFANGQRGQVGSTVFLDYGQPQNASSAADTAAAERFMEASFAWVADPLLTGQYPDSLRQAAGTKLPSFTPAQVTLVKGSIDFIGLKHTSARLCTEGERTPETSFSNDVNVATGLDQKWIQTPGGRDAITPWSIRDALNWVDARYNGVQVFVTENGYSGSGGNDVVDVNRSAYFSAYLRGVMRAVNEDGCNVMGYAARSLTDSFEWSSGYNVKYGLAHLDFSSESRPRSLKPAPAAFFRNALKNRKVDFVAFS